MTDLINTRLGQYQLVEAIGHGGASTVYKGYQESLDRFVAIKVLIAHHDPQFVTRFKREARAIAALQHYNILPIYDFGQQGDVLYLVTQYIENSATLGDALGTPTPPATALRLMGRVLDALDYAHTRGIIHRDIKPTNILLPSPDWPVLADFGIAKLLNDNQRISLTPANQIIGTATYMAPEQATGRPIDARTDLYAVGVVLYELVTGRVPFDAPAPMAVLLKQVSEPPPPPRALKPDLPTAVEAVLLHALAKDPAARFQTAVEMAGELNRLADIIERNSARSRLAGLYAAGLQAFEEGRIDQAIEQLGQLVALDPSYEDAAALLRGAQQAQERVKAEARARLEAIRARRQAGQPPTGTSDKDTK
jgi:eukaryotic-like serine/threonine-protein kinase